MQIVDDIFEAFDSPTGLAKAIKLPVQTVWEWGNKAKPGIPPWRREAILNAARREGKTLPSHCVEYLMSESRR